MSQEQNKNQQPPRKRRRKKESALRSFSLALLYVAFVIGISCVLAFLTWIAANDVLALDKDYKTATITITAEDDFGEITDILKENGLIEYPIVFNLFATVTTSKDDITPGTFTLNTDMDYRALIGSMNSYSESRAIVDITIPEGYTIAQIFQELENNGVATVEELNDIAANYDFAFSFLQDIPLGEPTRLEGYLYPDTYEFYTPHDPKYAINKMLVNFDSRLTDELRDEIADSGRTIHEIITVASMIEKETDGTDRENIASVIYNRLNNPGFETNGRLQIDATIYYITGREVTQNDRETLDSPYNTFMYAGLPVGPIASPGMNSILAAMEPADTNYYYYALGDDDLHHYYTTYDSFLGFLASQERYN